MQQIVFLSSVAVASSQFNYQQFLQRGQGPSDQATGWQQFVPANITHQYIQGEAGMNESQNHWQHYVPGNYMNESQYQNESQYHWQHYVPGNYMNESQYQNANMSRAWHQYIQGEAGVNRSNYNWQQYMPGANSSGQQGEQSTAAPTTAMIASATTATTTTLDSFECVNNQCVPTVGGITGELCHMACDATPIVAQSLSESPLKQKSPMFLMLALLAGAAVFAVVVGSRHRQGRYSEPLLSEENTVTLTD